MSSRPAVMIHVYTSPTSIISHRVTLAFDTDSERANFLDWLKRQILAGRIKADYETITRTTRSVRSAQHVVRQLAGLQKPRRAR